MPRKPRLQAAGLPMHIIQRGNNRQPCFYAEEDYRFFLDHPKSRDDVTIVTT